MPAVAELLRSRPTASEPIDDGDFWLFPDVPVWKEHTNTRDFEEPQTFTKADLQRVADHCNRRIANSGDYATIAIRHNREGQDADPPVVGFGGPYKLGLFGNEKPEWAILGNLRIFKEDLEKTKRYPRLSVEYWYSKDDPKGGYFDPISLLGSETPELDLGIRYGRNAHEGLRRACYSRLWIGYEASAPGGSNTFIPGQVSVGKKNKTTHAKENFAMLSEEDLGQIVTALRSIINEEVDAAMAAREQEGLDGGLGDGLGDEMTPYAKACKYMADEDEAGLKEYLGGMDEDQRAKFQADLDGEEDEERASYMQGALAPAEEPEEAGVAKADYAKAQTELAKYRKEAKQLRADYQRVQTENKKLHSENTELRQANQQAARYQKLQEMVDGNYVLDIDSELEDTSDFTEDQFDRHLERIKARYQKVGDGVLHVPKAEVYTPPKSEKQTEEDQKQSAHYAKVASDKVFKAREAGQEMSFADALKQAKEEAGTAA